MKRLLLIILLLVPAVVSAGEEVRIVKCTDGNYAVQDFRGFSIDCRGSSLDQPCVLVPEWRTIHGCPLTEEAAKRLKQEELDDRNRPPAPSVLYPVEVME